VGERDRQISRAFAGARLLTLAAGINASGSFLFHIFVARSGGTSPYGAADALLSFSFLASIVASGVQYAVARGVASGATPRSTALRSGLRATTPWLIGSGLALLASPAIGRYLHVSDSGAVAGAIGLCIALIVYAIPTGIMVGERRFGIFAFLTVSGVVIRLVLGAAMGLNVDTTSNAIWATSLSVGIVCVFGLIWASAGSHSARAESIDGFDERGLRHEATYNALLGAGLWLAWILPVVQARHFLSREAAGRFGAAAFLATGILFLISPLTTAFYPTIVRTRRVRPIVVGFLATAGLAAVCAIILTSFGSTIERVAYGRGFVVSWQCFFALGCSVALVAVATYGLWVTRGLQRFFWPSACGVGLTMLTEALLSQYWHPSLTALAGGPAIAVLVGGSVGCALAARSVRRASAAISTERAVQLLDVVRLDGMLDALAFADGHLLSHTCVGIMAHNEEANLERTLQAILSESDGNDRVSTVLVVASGCTDGTVDIATGIAAMDGRVRVLVEPERNGKASAINAFLAATTEPMCALVGGDTVLASGSLARLVRNLADESVGMVGARIVPDNSTSGIVDRASRALWELHDEMARVSPKLGEAVAFRRLFAAIDDRSLVDEVSIEAEVRAAGGELRYVPGAVVFNHGPTTIRDLRLQRARIHRGHLAVAASTGYRAASLDLQRILLTVARYARKRPRMLFATAVAVTVEMAARVEARLDHEVLGLPSSGVWTPVRTTKRPISPVVDLTTEDVVLTLPDDLYDSEAASRPAGRSSRRQA
jgi:O-antigen/teichoic acid export membrane protein/GT2 family glycosyltransferase